MCNFKSAIVVKEPRNKGGFQLLMSPWTESHSELITIHKLKDDARLKFARVEFTLKSMDEAYLPETYTLRIDEERTPAWFDDVPRNHTRRATGPQSIRPATHGGIYLTIVKMRISLAG